MTKMRNRVRQTMDLRSRLAMFADAARNAADRLPAGKQRTQLEEKARILERGIWMDDMLARPGWKTQLRKQ